MDPEDIQNNLEEPLIPVIDQFEDQLINNPQNNIFNLLPNVLYIRKEKSLVRNNNLIRAKNSLKLKILVSFIFIAISVFELQIYIILET